MSKPEESEGKEQRGRRSGTQEQQEKGAEHGAQQSAQQQSRWAEQYQGDRPKAQVDLNEASLEDLEKITGVGRERARDIIEHRPFKSWEDVEKVPGFSKGMVEDLQNSGATLGGEQQ